VNSDGLSSLLTEPTLRAEDLVQKLQPGLDILTAGPNPPDTTQLLSSKRCSVVMENIRAMSCYDLVIFDTPPTLLLGDSVLLAEYLDGILLVLGIGHVNRELPAQVIQRLRDAGVDVLGLLANHVKAEARQESKTYGYGYGYGYVKSSGTHVELAEHYSKGGETGDEDTEAYSNGLRGFRGQRMIRRAIVRVLSWVDKRQ
jgi:Mrp family chromosome partitioning ATPase